MPLESSHLLFLKFQKVSDMKAILKYNQSFDLNNNLEYSKMQRQEAKN